MGLWRQTARLYHRIRFWWSMRRLVRRLDRWLTRVTGVPHKDGKPRN